MSGPPEARSTPSYPPHQCSGYDFLGGVGQAGSDEHSMKLLSSIWTENAPLDSKQGSLPF